MSRNISQRLRKLEDKRGTINDELAALSDEELERRIAAAEEEMFPCLMEVAAADLLASLDISNPLDLETWRQLDLRTQGRILEAHCGPFFSANPPVRTAATRTARK